MKDPVKAYIDHLRLPGVAFMSIRDFNSKNGTKIQENRSLEQAIDKARKEMGPNDFLVHNFKHNALEQTASRVSQSKLEEEPSLDEMLAEEVEDEYEEVCDDCKKVHGESDCKQEALNDKTSGIKDEKALKHLVGFHSNGEVQLMKGKSRYIEQLKEYVGGDSTAEIRMFDGSKMLVSELNPNTDSLRELFSSFPSGPHLVVCD